jgi:hypothetical protein
VREVVMREGESGQETAHAIDAGPQAMPVIAGRAVPACWSAAGALIDLGVVTLVDRVAFEQSDAGWLPRPLVEWSDDGLQWTPVAATASLADATLTLYADPRHGLGELRFTPARTRYLRLDARLPARPGVLYVGDPPIQGS